MFNHRQLKHEHRQVKLSPRRWTLIFGLVLAAFLLIGCTSKTEPPATPPPPRASKTPIPETATPTLTLTPTPIPCHPPTENLDPNEWDYIVIGDSIMYGFLVQPPRIGYIGYLEQDLGIKVKIHNWERDSWSATGMLIALRTDVELRQAVCDAEVVIFEVPRKAFESPGQVFTTGTPGACGGTDNQECLRNALKLYQEHVDGIIAEIVSLRSPSEALIRTFDAHTYWPVDETKANGTFEGMNYYWQAANEYLVQVATANGIPVARVNEAFNGLNGDEDPFENGYVEDDYTHPNRKGEELMADLIRGLGYEFVP